MDVHDGHAREDWQPPAHKIAVRIKSHRFLLVVQHVRERVRICSTTALSLSRCNSYMGELQALVMPTMRFDIAGTSLFNQPSNKPPSICSYAASCLGHNSQPVQG